MKKGQVKKVYTVEQRLSHVEAFKNSGLSLAKYGKEHGIAEQTLYNWVSGRGQKKREIDTSFKGRLLSAWRDDRKRRIVLDGTLIVLLTASLLLRLFGHK